MILRISGALFLVCALQTLVSAQRSEPVTLKVPAGVIRGTLTVPPSPARPPLAVILSSSGGIDRDGNNGMMVNNNLKLLSDSLSKYGIASLRYDKRGVGASSALTDETRLRFPEYADDVKAWLQWARKQNRFAKIFIVGHGEGALVGMLAAQKTPVSGVVAIGAPGRPIDSLLLEQLSRQGLKPGPLDTTREMFRELRQTGKVAEVPPGPFYITIFRKAVQPYLVSWMKYDPVVEIARLRCPVLLVQGDNDLQTDTTQIRLLSAALPAAKAVVIPGMNQVFRQAPTDPAENMDTYYTDTLPLDTTLVRTVSAFIRQGGASK